MTGTKMENQDHAKDRTNTLHFSSEEGPFESCTIVILGASGDLTARKIIPALYNLTLAQQFTRPLQIVGASRTVMNDDEFRMKMRSALEGHEGFSEKAWSVFAQRLHYRCIQYDDISTFSVLADYLDELDRISGAKGNRIFYLAVPPTLYQVSAEMIGRVGLAAEGENGNGWSRIVVEKPFGRDLETAMVLDRSLHEFFSEHQIFRIDHYLAKETVQNVLMFRFANAIFEPIWNRRYIEHVKITAVETLGVEHRAGYYEQAGVLRDMFQNHMMQLLAITAMDPPSVFEADRVRDEKIRVFRSLRPFPVDDLDKYIIVGQYGRGVIDGEEIPGYREEVQVNPKSLIPTYASLKVFIDNWRWQGVPFYLTSGKRLSEKLTELTIQFKVVPHLMFRHTFGEEIAANQLTLGIYPDERISLSFQAKNPGARIRLKTVTMDFHYDYNYSSPLMEAYEKVLLDCILGDHMLFWRQDGVELCWSFLTPILNACETCHDRVEMLKSYEAGGGGPGPFPELAET
ncbi:MAG: glucose-6-phosphate dehydrogenase [Deltaproteobacteria bacterium]|nr:glucose-6-phosphate dehydrogenase [Deltaproteobacteria bacterium]